MTFHTMQNSAAYNSLPEVFLADSALLSNDRNNIIEKLFEIIYKHKAEAFVGLRLLHKHNTIFENELMIEDVSFDKEGFALITRAQAIVGRSEDIVPNSWILSNFTFIPLEYSKRELVHEPTFNPDTQIVFFTELAEKLLELGVSQLIGPALISSDLVEKNKPQGANLMFEMSDHDGRANIL